MLFFEIFCNNVIFNSFDIFRIHLNYTAFPALILVSFQNIHDCAVIVKRQICVKFLYLNGSGFCSHHLSYTLIEKFRLFIRRTAEKIHSAVENRNSHNPYIVVIL